MQDIPTFADLPVDIIDRICKYLFLPGEDFKQQVDLLSLSTTCRVGYECARALLWQNAYVNFQQRSLHELRVLQRLQIVLSTPNHPIFTLTKRIQILLPRWGLNLPRDELDAVVGALIARMTSLKQIYIRLSGHTDPDVRFHHTLESIFRHEQLVSVSLTNYAGNRKFDTQVKPSITDLTLGQNGIPLALDLHSFPHLRRLHLSTNCYDDGSHNLTHWQIPSSLWRTLDTFVLHVGDGWAHAFLVSQAVMDSVQVGWRPGPTHI